MAGGAHEHEIVDIKQLSETVADIKESIETIGSSVTEALGGLSTEVEDLKKRVAKLELGNSGTPGPTGPSTWVPAFPGDTKPGTIRWGCSYNSNGIPTTHEAAAGVSVGVRRTFWQLSQASSLIAACKADVAAGRVPWVSIKPGTSWKNVAAGTIDTQLSNLIKNLGTVGGPVWFTVHHEPEGGNGTPYPDDGQGTEPDWINMQKKIRVLVDQSGVKNVAFGSCLMAWTFDSNSGRNPADWWVADTWDFAGLDHYVEASSGTVITPMWKNALAFYKAKGIKIALGEWGNKDHSVTGAAEMQEWYDHLRSQSVIGACYFDTSLNGGVPLSGAALDKFRELMKAPTSIRL